MRLLIISAFCLLALPAFYTPAYGETLPGAGILPVAHVTPTAAQPLQYMMTKPRPSDDCNATSAHYPPTYSSFASTETEAYLWFYVTGLNAGDVFSTEYYMPDGQFYTAPSGDFDPVSEGGNWCFTDVAFKIAGYPPASAPGTWTVKVKYNRVQLFQLTFKITPGGTGGSVTGYSVNLLENPNAEASAATSDCSPGSSVPGWTATGQFTVCSYGQPGYPNADSPGPPSRGNNFFFGGFEAESTATQSLDVSWAAADIDRGAVSYALSGYVGGFDTQDDNATVKALFRASPFGTATQAMIGPVYASDRSGVTGLLLRSATGTVPAGTRQIDIVQGMTRVSGSANDGYTDSLAFTLTLGASACSYSLEPLSATIPAAGGTATLRVAAGAGCAWTAVSNVSWISIQAGTSGSGDGSVTYHVDANSVTSARTGTITVAGMTHTVTQAAGAACSYAITPASNTLLAQGGSGSVRLSTGDGCAWTASTAASWVRLTSANSGTGSATIGYAASANTAAASRSAVISIAGQTFALTELAQASASVPILAQGGIVNAASNRSNSIARGSFFTIYGSNIGPATWLQAAYPLPQSLSGVEVSVSQGSTTRRAYLNFVSSGQINGILPSDTPLGEVQLSVRFRGAVSAPSHITVVDTAFGIFSTAGGSGPGVIQNWVSSTSAPLNRPSSPAMPGQTMILWGTGLGPVSTADNLPPTAGDLPVPVEVRIGGKLAKRLYSGRAPGFSAVDNVYFRVPADAPAGCSVPVQVKAASHWSNTVRMAISADGSQCQDPANPFGGLTAKGGKTGLIALLRVGLNGQLDSSRPPASITLDLGLGLFSETRAGGDFSFSPLKDLPPLGTCASTERALDLESLLKTGGSGLDPTTVRQLDAGAQLTIIGPNGSRTLPHLDTTTSTGPYGGLLGGSSPLSDDSPLPLFLDGGSYTISAPGGADIGAFSTTLKLAPGIQWTNQAQIGTISRSAGVTVKWTGGDASQTILLLGGSTNQKTKEAGGFFCLAAASDGAFTVPPSTLADLPPTGTTTSLSDSIAALAIAALPMSHPQKFTAPGLDGGLVFDATIWGKTVQVK